jgi:HAAS
MDRERYLSDLTAQMQRRGVADNRIADIIAEVESHLVESGESPADAFGPAEEYAEKMATFWENKAEEPADTLWHNRTFRATAIDEMEILRKAGLEGWELMGVGPYALFCRRPVNLAHGTKWEHKRRTGIHQKHITEEMAKEQWQPCGNWIVFHYFKRQAGSL